MQRQASALKTPVRPASTGHKRGWVGNSPTPAQLKAFFEQIPTEENPGGINTTERLQQYLRNAPFATERTASVITVPKSKNKLAKLAEETVFGLFPNRYQDMMEILAPFLVPDFQIKLEPQLVTEDKTHVRTTPSSLMQVPVDAAFSFWIKVLGVSVRELNADTPYYPEDIDVKQEGNWCYAEVLSEMYQEPLEVQHNLNASLKGKVRNVVELTAQPIAQAYHGMEALRYRLIDDNGLGRVTKLLRKLLEVAITMAAVGDTERMEHAKAGLAFQLGGNPLVDYHGMHHLPTILCAPPKRV